MNRQSDGQIDRQTDGQTDGQTDRHAARQKDRLHNQQLKPGKGDNSYTHRYLRKIDCSSFVLCLLLVLVLPKGNLVAATNRTNRKTRQYKL